MAFHMVLVVGAPVRRASRLHIGAFLLRPERAVCLYTKHHLGALPSSASPDGVVPPAENTVFAPGDLNPLVSVGDETAAVAICSDVGRPAHAAAAAERGASNYLASMFVIPSDLEDETANLRGYATRHAMTVVFANYGGPTGGLPSGGMSAIWSERGELLAQLGTTGAGIVASIQGREGWRGEAIVLENGRPD